MKTKSRSTGYIVYSLAAAAALLLTAQISLAGSATWLSTPQDSAWQNPNVLYKLKPEVAPARVEAMMMWPHV